MRNTLCKRLSALLIACMLVPAPLALMEEELPVPVAAEQSEAALTAEETEAPVEDALEVPVEEITLELGDEANESEPVLTAESEDQILELGADETPATVESEPLPAEAAEGEALPLEAERFPDPYFREYLEEYDTDGDGQLSDAEIAKIKKINCFDGYVESLEGLNYLTELQNLDCSYCYLGKLDVSRNTKLTNLYCPGNEIDELNVSMLPNLKLLSCSGNNLTSLNVSNNPNLTTLWCSSNQLSTLDVSHNPELASFDCGGCNLSKLDVSNNPKLLYLYCAENGLTKLDISNCPKLLRLDCRENDLSALDVSQNSKLEYLKCNLNYIPALDVSKCQKLRYLDCTNTYISTLDISMLALSEITFDYESEAYGGHIEYGDEYGNFYLAFDETVKLKTSQNSGNTVVDLDEDAFPDEYFREYVAYKFDISGDGALSSGEIGYAKEIDIRDNEDIESVKGIEYLTALEAVTFMRCDGITKLDFSGNTKLTDLYLSDLPLTSLNVTGNKALKELDCRNCNLSTLDVTKNTALERLVVGGNQLTALDVSKNKALKVFGCWNNRLTDLDVSMNAEIEDMSCDGNNLKTLNLGRKDKLWYLEIEGNQIASLDIRGCPLIEKLLNHSDTHAYYYTNDDGYEYVCFELTADGREYDFYADKNVNVIFNDPVPSVKLTKNGSYTLNVGEKIRIDLDGAVATSYKSNKPKVASVDSSLVVTGVGEGKATITVKVGKQTRKLTLTVNDPTKPTGIKLDKNGTIEQDCNQKLQLHYTLEPKGAISGVTWKSSSPKIATVDQNGLVTPIKEGKATITVTTTKGKKKYSAKVNLKIFDPKKPSGVHLNYTGTVNLDVADNKNLTLIASIEPSTAESPIVWKSSSEKIAKVKDGVVTLLQAGTVTITATLTKVKKSAKVKLVIKDQHAPKKIAINQGKSINLEVGKTQTLTTTITGTPGFEPRKAVKWTSSKPGVVSVDGSGKITAVAPGTAKITVTAEKAKASITVKVPKTK